MTAAAPTPGPSPTPTAPRIHDCIVVGAGHNGLVAACYLAQAGEDVLVVERDSIPGGAVSTIERFPGYRVDRGSSAHIMIRHTTILDDLELDRFGLRYLDCDPWAFAPADGDSPGIAFRTDLDATCRSIEAACGTRDAEAYRRFVEVWGPRSAAVMSMFTRQPTPGRFARAFWGMPTRDGRTGRAAGPELSQEFIRSGDALLDSWFESERLKAALAWFGAQSGPPMSEPGTASMVGIAALMHRIPPGRAVGGSGALTEALVARLRSDGGTLRCDAPVTALSRIGDHWEVRTDDGQVHRARSVVAACHVFTTLAALTAGGFDADTAARWQSRTDLGPGIGSAIRVATTELPRYPGLPDELPAHGVHSGLGLLVSDRGHMAQACGDSRAGELPRRPVVLAMSFSAIDPSLAPPEHHLITLWAQWHPRQLSGGRAWSDHTTEATDAILGEMDRHAPGFIESIAHVHAQTPDRLESELGLVGGNVMHLEMSMDQMFLWRPHPDLAGRRVPGAPALYLAGASTHPGGGVSGISGSLAAAQVLADRPGRSRRLLAGAATAVRSRVTGGSSAAGR
ncbi:NAD(P)/FAD-dependent oxidoreductase [Williamsia sp. CHRR-6]|uniref:phytoene desaturase family protein n=1 Tax=Williamsia sp. CHRR-6 TaxID=2835871 RepID=UPI001BDB1D43|nr:NAD(P)/FAD-dependent oxidoreductase [Williamsia sp. CHRR-6]MBT0565274.1 NAD(P)/FAD-dependent oxidoreductase [Williamsia sp. CHRR-6]